ncbi:MAG: chemotaxis protein CheW [Candidatus Woesearchaeota archaeon]
MEDKTIDEFQIVTFKLGNERFGIDIDELLEIVRIENITRVPNTKNFVEGVINLRGKIIVVLDLLKKLNIGKIKITNSSRILVVKTEEELTGLLVDSCEDVMTISIDKVQNAPKILEEKINTEYIRGVIFDKKEIIVLLDLNKLIAGKDFSLN